MEGMLQVLNESLPIVEFEDGGEFVLAVAERARSAAETADRLRLFRPGLGEPRSPAT